MNNLAKGRYFEKKEKIGKMRLVCQLTFENSYFRSRPNKLAILFHSGELFPVPTVFAPS
ncbi:MAG: hypothetical protein ACRC10_05745 [Thermoguttaceae bacterium]